MTWTDIQSAWHEFAGEILTHWPELHGDRIVAIAGDRSEFARYLSNAYDLTFAEAMEAIETWILRITSGGAKDTTGSAAA